MSETQQAYRVLARKYRPQNFDELIGQDALVQTLKNAIESGRVAHAFMLTGVRGVGKTTTARIIAKALNYTGADGTAGPTTGPTDDCETCQAIAQDRHPDVIEMDAASRTGIDDIREILDGVRYAPTSARYKIYIIDEVHMLSRQAFNALLKTLEEPPEHVKFIFATTEIRKVPVTVLSRCQRFDLRRVDAPTLFNHYKDVCGKEGAQAQDQAIALIARAADGSVRDGLSLLDQAIALGADEVTERQVKDMLGLADRARILDLLEHAVKGECKQALEIMKDLNSKGADPVILLQDMLDLTHMMTKFRAVPALQDSGQDSGHESGQIMAKEELERTATLAQNLPMPSLGRVWQLLLKGLQEVGTAPDPQIAAEMIIIRLAYAAELPDPAALIRKLKDQQDSATAPSNGQQEVNQGTGTGTGTAAGTRMSQRADQGTNQGAETGNYRNGSSLSGTTGSGTDGSPVRAAITADGAHLQAQVQAQPEAQASAQDVPAPNTLLGARLETLADIVTLLERGGEILLGGQLYQFAHLVKLEQGRLEIRPAPEAPPRLAQDLGAKLTQITEQRWMVSVSGACGQPTLAQQDAAARDEKFERVLQDPAVQEIVRLFPGARLDAVHDNEKQEKGE